MKFKSNLTGYLTKVVRHILWFAGWLSTAVRDGQLIQPQPLLDAIEHDVIAKRVAS